MVNAISLGSRITDAGSVGSSILGLVKSYFGNAVTLVILMGLPWKSQVKSSKFNVPLLSRFPAFPLADSYEEKSCYVALNILD